MHLIHLKSPVVMNIKKIRIHDCADAAYRNSDTASLLNLENKNLSHGPGILGINIYFEHFQHISTP